MSFPFASIMNWLLRRMVRFLALPQMSPVRQAIKPYVAKMKQEAVSIAESDIPEIGPLVPRSDKSMTRRLNLLIPSVSKRHVFGGAQTALLVLDALRAGFDSVRIVSTDDSEADCVEEAYYSLWPVVDLGQEPLGENHIVTAGSRYGKTLAVGCNDYFLATAWWTAHNGFKLIEWQRSTYSLENRRLIYLIQDYEPGFYKWSARYALAAATYSHPETTVALINSHILKEFMDLQGCVFRDTQILEPRLNPELALHRSNIRIFQKERILFVYGRPGVERNALPLIVSGLRIWAGKYPNASKWQVISAGEAFSAIDLGNGCMLRSVGKLDIEEYASLLERTAVGISLMISPHPSYPPLELASFGARVVTNGFANKDLSTVCSLIRSVRVPDPDSIAGAIADETAKFDAIPEDTHFVHPESPETYGGFLDSDKWAESWPSKILESVLGRDILSIRPR
jgi:hypothetical protein